MTASAEKPQFRPELGDTSALSLWGLHIRDLHDRFWAAHGVQVVRRGLDEIHASGPKRYLLLEPDDLVLFDLPHLNGSRLRSRGDVLEIHLSNASGDGYAETIDSDSEDLLIRIQRRYRPDPKSSRTVLVSRDPTLASRWHEAKTRRVGMCTLRRAAGLKGYRVTNGSGLLYVPDDPADARQCALDLMRRWRRLDRACTGIRKMGRNVWAHESATIEPNARFVGTVWIGAGASVRDGDVIVGPWIVRDEIVIPPVAKPNAWPRLRSPGEPRPKARRERSTGRLGRRLFNIAFSLTALLLSAPLFPLIMLAIWLEDGRPFFFAHVRQTVGGRNFVCFKFRTMCRNAEELKAQFILDNICDGPQFHIENDPRLLRIGRFMRKLHLDELPQFYNVLLGQMDVIGPRPSPDEENQFCPAWREARLSVKPGMTGLWQVSRTRAPNTDFQEWIRYDLDYVEHRNWRLDLWIIFRTSVGILSHAVRVLRPRRTPQSDNAPELTAPQEARDGAAEKILMSAAGGGTPSHVAARDHDHRSATTS